MEGTYKLASSGYYQAEGKRESIIISKRKHARPGMSSFFMLSADENGKRAYISSLYPISRSTYSIEKNGNRYVVTIGEDHLSITNQQ